MAGYQGASARLSNAKSPAQSAQRHDSIPAESRATSEDGLNLRLASELDFARLLLDEMGDDLSSDPLVIARHMTALQSVDIVGQMLGHIANVVRSSDPGEAVESIGMNELKVRLKGIGGV